MKNDPPSQTEPRHAREDHLPLNLGLAAALLFFLLSGFATFRNTRLILHDAQQVTRTHDIIRSLENVLSLIKDAETGQRGFIITGDEKYLQSFTSGRTNLQAELPRAGAFLSDDPMQQNRLARVETLIAAKFAELDETIALRREQGFEAARAVVVTDRGKADMDSIRSGIAGMIDEEIRERKQRIIEMGQAHRAALASGVLTGVLGAALSCVVAWLIRRAATARQLRDWIQRGKLGLTDAMAREQGLESLGQSILAFLSRYVDAHAGAMFAQRGGQFRRVATYGVPLESAVPEQFQLDDGLLGRAVVENAPRRIDDVPEGYLTVGSGLGRSSPRHLFIVPAANTNAAVNAVMELGFVHPLEARAQDFLEQISEPIGVAVKSALYRENLQELLSETQQQSEELQAQTEELRVSNEELEEQGRALKESQTRLELGQAELEQTNTQLEEQAQILEGQKAALEDAKQGLEAQARVVERASRYKSDFLANMSHELRTPLNSSLILAKLLAENRSGNLTPEQIEYALTIESAGNDLLTLINDVLDLSKIEAGQMAMNAGPLHLETLLGNLRRTFGPVAGQKALELRLENAPDAPEILQTDGQRIEQVLKNLLSNALKFTERGSVTLGVSRAEAGRVAFAVSDSGIGIAPEQQRAIFDPFVQADGTTNRKYGGTGLGLSISREMARLLGGEIRLTSEEGRGSTFTLLVPEILPSKDAELPAPLLTEPAPPKPRATPATAPRIADDRETLTGSGRVILTVEDDVPFAKIVRDLAHELQFQSLIATTAEEALALAQQHRPSAIVLDVGLPDNSGLFVLERLKADARTRHIPVHIVSGSDYTQKALSLGAVGYMLKPVQREQLVEAFQKLETRFTQKMRRVLVVEDDAVQADALQRLLGSREVETVSARTAAECLEQLKTATFDCMVLDLSLPDASGFSLLETLSNEDAYSFPPVIVYTGRELSADEEQRLRRYSKSIIIKGAKSPERLLDEVTLFLHQVVADLPPEQQRMLEKSTGRDAALEGRRVLIAEDDVRNIFALTSLLEGRGVKLQIARNGREAVTALERSLEDPAGPPDLVLMDVMMPEMDGLTATREIRKRAEFKKLPIIMLTAKAMQSDHEQCLAAGANDYLAKPLDVEKLLSLVRVWMPR